MKIIHPEPLSSEERELAAMLARVAPHGVPSPEIDASILSASHDAVAGPAARARRPRWPVAMGVAASMVLAVGVAWQLRPTQPEVAPVAAASIESMASVESAAAPVVPAVVSSERANEAAAESAAQPLPDRSMPSRPQAPVPDAATAAPAAAMSAQVQPPSAPPAPPTPAYAARPPPAVPTDAAEPKAATRAGTPGVETARQADTATASSQADSAAAAGRRELRVAPGSERAQEKALSPANGAARTRRTDLQVPVAADAQLQPGDWLERVRTRYGLGDEDAARRSLLLFVQDHPTAAVPVDLEPLLDE